jgi:hypothetical protein
MTLDELRDEVAGRLGFEKITADGWHNTKQRMARGVEGTHAV